jgi:2-phospho-L-lactate guanylyltransferase
MTAAVLPVKRFGRAKQRLSGLVGGGGRRELAEAMVGDVLAALGLVPGIDLLVVVTAEPRAVELAAAAGAVVIDDPLESSHSDAAELGVACAVERGATRVLLVPGDCPALDPAEVTALLARDEPVVVVPDRHGTGTNALLLAPPHAIAPAFGPGSFARHAASARAAGLTPGIAAVPSLGLDVDTPDDLATVRAALERTGRGERTRAALTRLAAAAA